MTDLKRKKGKQYAPFGMPSPDQIQDQSTRVTVQAMQANIFDLQRQIDALKSAASDTSEVSQNPVQPKMPDTGLPDQFRERIYIVDLFSGLANIRGIREGDRAYVRETKQWFGYRTVTGGEWRALHTWMAATLTALNALDDEYGVNEGDIGYEEENDGIYYFAGGSWTEFGTGTVIVAANYAGLNALSPSDGALGYIQDKDWFYGRRNGAWRILHTFRDSTTPSSVGEQDGDIFYNTSTNKGYMRASGTFKLITHYNV